jgi:cell shape-determining protein MreC
MAANYIERMRTRDRSIGPMRFQHVFLALMGLSVLSAFVLPQGAGAHFHPQVSMLFAPVARPAGAIAELFFHKMGGDRSDDPRDLETIRRENEELKVTVKTLTAQLLQLAQRDAEREALGDIGKLCTPVAVVGEDAGERESLTLRSSTLEGIDKDMFVIYRGGIAGRIASAGVAGAQVMLESDVGFRVRGQFGKFVRRNGQVQFIKLDAPVALVEGAGKNEMVVRVLTLADAHSAGIVPGVSVIVAEPDWPRALQGQPLGNVMSVIPRPDAPLYAEIHIEPQEYLKRLRTVMVLTKEQ